MGDLTDLGWAFNFSAQAGGQGLTTAQIVRFVIPNADEPTHGFLHMRLYPPLRFVLHESILQIANFPDHIIERLPSWEWRISNSNVVFVSGPVLPDDLEGRGIEVIEAHMRSFPDSRLLGISED